MVEHDENEPWYVTLWQKIKEIFVPEENELKEHKEHKEQSK